MRSPCREVWLWTSCCEMTHKYLWNIRITIILARLCRWDFITSVLTNCFFTNLSFWNFSHFLWYLFTLLSLVYSQFFKNRTYEKFSPPNNGSIFPKLKFIHSGDTSIYCCEGIKAKDWIIFYLLLLFLSTLKNSNWKVFQLFVLTWVRGVVFLRHHESTFLSYFV